MLNYSLGGVAAFFLGATFVPVKAGGGPPDRAVCMSNLKQLGAGTILYAADYDDRFPMATRWNDEIVP